MKKSLTRNIFPLVLIWDLLILNGTFILPYLLYNNFQKTLLGPEFFGFLVYLNLSWITLAMMFSIYYRISRERAVMMLSISMLMIVVFFFIFLLYFQVVTFNYLDRDSVKNYFILFFLLIIFSRQLQHFSLPAINRKLGHQRIAIIVGYNQTARDLQAFLENDPLSNFRFIGYFTDNQPVNAKVLGKYDTLGMYLLYNNVDDIFLIPNLIPSELRQKVAEIAGNESTSIHLVPDISFLKMMNVSMEKVGNIPLLRIERSPLNNWHNAAIKRFFDVTMALFVLILILSWLTPLLWLLNRLLYRQGVFFIQERNGLNNRPFRCIKYRSMVQNAKADKEVARRHDPRITTLGKFLRRTSIDELPQFINVLAGQMSLVGPRPHMLKHTKEYRQVLRHFMVRHIVRPGLTGLAQINGFRGGIFNRGQLINRVKFDIKYIENWTFWMDIKIILLTVLNLFKNDSNAY